MQKAKGHARYRSSACGNVASSVFFKSAQVTLWGSQNLSFQNHARIPAISLQHTPWPGQKTNWWTALSSRFLAGDLADEDDDDDDGSGGGGGGDDDIRAGSPSVPFPSARPVRLSAPSQLLRKRLVPWNVTQNIART